MSIARPTNSSCVFGPELTDYLNDLETHSPTETTHSPAETATEVMSWSWTLNKSSPSPIHTKGKEVVVIVPKPQDLPSVSVYNNIVSI